MKNGELLSLALDSPSFFRDAQGPECLVAFGGSYVWNLGEEDFILRDSTNSTWLRPVSIEEILNSSYFISFPKLFQKKIPWVGR